MPKQNQSIEAPKVLADIDLSELDALIAAEDGDAAVAVTVPPGTEVIVRTGEIVTDEPDAPEVLDDADTVEELTAAPVAEAETPAAEEPVEVNEDREGEELEGDAVEDAEVIAELSPETVLADAETVAEIAQGLVNDPNPALNDDDLDDLDAVIERQQAYQAQKAAHVVVNDPTATAKLTEPAKATRTPRAAGTGTPRAANVDLHALPADLFVLEGDVSTMSDADKDAAKAATLAAKPKQVKIAEKFENLLTAIHAGRRPSRYTEIAFGLFATKPTITSADIVGAYRAAGLGDGTARSQSGQMMELFNALGVAKRAGQTLTLNPNSIIASKLTAILGAGTASTAPAP